MVETHNVSGMPHHNSLAYQCMYRATTLALPTYIVTQGGKRIYQFFLPVSIYACQNQQPRPSDCTLLIRMPCRSPPPLVARTCLSPCYRFHFLRWNTPPRRKGPLINGRNYLIAKFPWPYHPPPPTCSCGDRRSEVSRTAICKPSSSRRPIWRPRTAVSAFILECMPMCAAHPEGALSKGTPPCLRRQSTAQSSLPALALLCPARLSERREEGGWWVGKIFTPRRSHPDSTPRFTPRFFTPRPPSSHPDRREQV